ncbi:MAG: hypothetical protein GC165_19405 [Armatimonadetes bacterium]|nr:hypothetical protein [Armatimonadota bacterium]
MDQEELAREVEDLEREIRLVFDGVTRTGTVTWGESCRQNYEVQVFLVENLLQTEKPSALTDAQWTDVIRRATWDESDRVEAFGDSDSHWQDLIDDPSWKIGEWGGSFLYLDPVGRRYYLPAAMLRGLREPDSIDLAHDLMLRPGEREMFLDRWSALTDPEVECVKRFVAFKAAWIEAEYEMRRQEGGAARYFLPIYEETWKDEC